MTEASTQTTQTPSEQRPRAPGVGRPLVDTIFDLGVGWAATGLKLGKTALEQSAKTLEQTAKALANLASRGGSRRRRAAGRGRGLRLEDPRSR